MSRPASAISCTMLWSRVWESIRPSRKRYRRESPACPHSASCGREVDEQRDHGAVHVPGAVGVGLMPPQLHVGVDQQVLHLVGARQRRERGLLDDVTHDELGGDVAAAVAAGAVGDDAAQALVGAPMAARVLIVGATARPRQARELELPRSVCRRAREPRSPCAPAPMLEKAVHLLVVRLQEDLAEHGVEVVGGILANARVALVEELPQPRVAARRQQAPPAASDRRACFRARPDRSAAAPPPAPPASRRASRTGASASRRRRRAWPGAAAVKPRAGGASRCCNATSAFGENLSGLLSFATTVVTSARISCFRVARARSRSTVPPTASCRSWPISSIISGVSAGISSAGALRPRRNASSSAALSSPRPEGNRPCRRSRPARRRDRARRRRQRRGAGAGLLVLTRRIPGPRPQPRPARPRGLGQPA